MKEKMMALVQEMVDHGYHLSGETVEQFVDRMIGYGFDVKFQQECHDRFLNGGYVK